MRSIFIFSVLILSLILSFGIVIDSYADEGFYAAIGTYYKVPQRDVVLLRERGIPHDEMPVVLFMANRARVEPSVIIDFRLRNRGWMDIMLHFGLSPEMLYVPVKRVYGPPFGKAYGYYKNKPRKDWKLIVLDDNDVINLVNLRFVSEHYGYPPERVIEMRAKGKTFIEINKDIEKEKKSKREDIRGDGKENRDKQKGKGRKDRD